MKHSIWIVLIAGVLLQGCASTRGNVNDQEPSSAPQNRNMVASPAAAISAGSGAMHTGMSGYN